MAVGDVYKLIDRQVQQSVEVLNIYHYVQTAGTGDSTNLGNAFIDTLLPLLIAVQSSSVTHESVEVTNYSDPADFSTDVLSTDNVGLRTGEFLPRHNGWGFKLNRAARTLRNGSKRVAGVAETDQQNGTINSGLVTDIDTLALAMGAELIDGTDRFQPVIARLSTTAPITVLDTVEVQSGQYTRITTQNSRKT